MRNGLASGSGDRPSAARRSALRRLGLPGAVATLRALRPALATGAGAALAGCGFQLRGSANLPFRTLFASFPPTAAATGADFRRMLRATGETRLVERPEDAEARLEVLSETREKEIVGFSSTGRPREYQLRLRVSFRLLDTSGLALIPVTELLLRRDITTTDTQLIAKEQEEALLYREMQGDVVQQLLRRLSAVRPEAAREAARQRAGG